MICLVCEPRNLRIEQPINSFHLEWIENPPDVSVAGAQHAGLVAALERLGVEVLKVPPLDDAPYQVFMRDVLIGGLGVPILANLREPVRRPELDALRATLERASIPFVPSAGGHLEGGDVVVSGTQVFVGVGDRTERGAAEWLRETYAPDYQVEVLGMRPGFLHLDMVFNVFGPDSCVLHPDALEPESAERIRERFGHVLEIDRAAQRRMSTNFLPVGDSDAIASTTAIPEVGEAAAAAGREFHFVELNEIQKGGGSVRCSTCLLQL